MQNKYHENKNSYLFVIIPHVFRLICCLTVSRTHSIFNLKNLFSIYQLNESTQ
jgi:hypothetical protein